jgi:hypothetical protein
MLEEVLGFRRSRAFAQEVVRGAQEPAFRCGTLTLWE